MLAAPNQGLAKLSKTDGDQATIRSFRSATRLAACTRIAAPFSLWSSSRAASVFFFLDCPSFRTSRRASSSASALTGSLARRLGVRSPNAYEAA
jgi:hypothetical protein